MTAPYLNPLRSIGFTQERLHSGLLAFLTELYRGKKQEPLEEFLRCLGFELKRCESIRVDFERFRGDVVLETKGDIRQLLVFEFKVDAYEGGFLSENAASKQTHKLFERAVEQPADERGFFYVTLGDGEFSGPPAHPAFRWIRLSAFLEAVRRIESAHPTFRNWTEILSEEESRRLMAPELAAASTVSSIAEQARDLGFRTIGVFLGTYGAVIQAWARVGFSQKYGQLRAYGSGRGPDPILNVWGQWATYRGHDLYLEVNRNGTLNLKIGGAGPELALWSSLCDALRAHGARQAPQSIRDRPRPGTDSNTICTWPIGLWSGAAEPERIARNLASVLDDWLPCLRAICAECRDA